LNTPTPVLNIQDVCFRWPGQASFALALDRFSLEPQEKVLLLGESGSGKSTLLSLICGTILPKSGRIWHDGSDITAMSGARRDQFRAEQIGVIFQQFNLLPFGTVRDNILLPLSFAPQRRARVKDQIAETKELCKALGLPTDISTMRAGALSVGQQQRVAVARALIGKPPLIIADEPTSALDATSQAAFLDLMFGQLGESGSALLMVSHDPQLGERFDRVIDLADIAKIERHAA